MGISCKKDNANDVNKAQASETKPTWKRDVDSNTQQFRNIYKKARQLHSEKNYKDAYDLYSVLDKNYAILYDFVLFQRADVAKNIPDEASVIKDLTTLISDYPKSPLIDAAIYSLGQAYVRINDDENVEKTFTELINKYPDSTYSIAANYYLGELQAKSPQKIKKAISHFELYLKEAPDGKFAVNSAEAIIKLKGEDNLTPRDKELVGVAFYHGGDYKKAIKYLVQVFNENTWYALGKSYQLTAQTTSAIEIFKKALNTFTGLDPEEVDNAIKATARIKGNTFDAWKYCQQAFPKQADVALYFQADRLYVNQALPYYQKIVDNYPDSRYAPESNWVLFWNAFSNKQYDNAIARGKLHAKSYPSSNSLSRIVYWVGKAYERKGENSKAIKVYEKMTNRFLGDYYTYRAKGRLDELKYNKSDNMWTTIPYGYSYSSSWTPPVPIDYEDISILYGNKFAELLYLDDIDSLNYILPDKVDPRLDSYFHLRNDLKSKAIVVLRDNQEDSIKKPPGYEKAWELLYPLHFSETIKANAAKNSIDPLLVQALTREESYFNHQAVSSSNAKGLMQLIPSTATAVAGWEKLSSFSQFDLFKPEINIRLGTRYLKYTHDTFSGNSMLAVAAYNGGPGNVKKWLNSLSTDDWDQFVENIPLSETRNYVRKVFRSYWAYRDIYASDK